MNKIYIADQIEDVFHIYRVREDGEYDPKVAEAYDQDTADTIVLALNQEIPLLLDKFGFWHT